MHRAMDLVEKFHDAFDIPRSPFPHLPHEDRRKLRVDLLNEEWKEYKRGERNDDMVAIADGLADMVVIICGTAHEYGIPLSKVFAEVMRSNMTKLGEDGKPIYREDGKVLKGPNYEPPHIGTIITKEMYGDIERTEDIVKNR